MTFQDRSSMSLFLFIYAYLFLCYSMKSASPFEMIYVHDDSQVEHWCTRLIEEGHMDSPANILVCLDRVVFIFED